MEGGCKSHVSKSSGFEKWWVRAPFPEVRVSEMNIFRRW
jgi:hypothetical protein